MGVVLRGVDPALERPVAIKLIATRPHSGVSGEEMEARFLREARVAARINHAGVVTVFDAGREGSSLYLVMELIEGESLGDKLARGEYLEPSAALELVAKVAEALAAAHALGIVHRDVKPSNVMITTDGRVKVADFGVAKAVGEDTNLTRTGTVVGSPAYMAPEQVRGQQLDGRSDLFSLGVVLYELLLHRKPFPSETVTTLIYQILHEDPLASPEISRALGDDVAALLRRCLAKTPEERFPDGLALAAATRTVAVRLAQVALAQTHAAGGLVIAPATLASSTPVAVTPTTSQRVPSQPPSATPATGTAPRRDGPAPLGAAVAPVTPTGTAPVAATRTTGAPVATGTATPPVAAADVMATSPTRQIAAAPPPPVPPVAPPVQATPAAVPQKTPRVLLGVLLAVVGLALLGVAAFVAFRAWRLVSGPQVAEPTPPPPTVAVVAVATATPEQQVPTPWPTFTPTGLDVAATPTTVAEWWPTPTPVAVATTLPVVLPTEIPTLTPSTPTPLPTEPTVVATFKCKKGVKFSLSPEEAEITIDGTKIGTADDWDDAGGGTVFEFATKGVHYARIALAGYQTAWVKIVVDPAATDDIADVDSDLKKEKKKK